MDQPNKVRTFFRFSGFQKPRGSWGEKKKEFARCYHKPLPRASLELKKNTFRKHFMTENENRDCPTGLPRSRPHPS